MMHALCLFSCVVLCRANPNSSLMPSFTCSPLPNPRPKWTLFDHAVWVRCFQSQHQSSHTMMYASCLLPPLYPSTTMTREEPALIHSVGPRNPPRMSRGGGTCLLNASPPCTEGSLARVQDPNSGTPYPRAIQESVCIQRVYTRTHTHTHTHTYTHTHIHIHASE